MDISFNGIYRSLLALLISSFLQSPKQILPFTVGAGCAFPKCAKLHITSTSAAGRARQIITFLADRDPAVNFLFRSPGSYWHRCFVFCNEAKIVLRLLSNQALFANPAHLLILSSTTDAAGMVKEIPFRSSYASNTLSATISGSSKVL